MALEEALKEREADTGGTELSAALQRIGELSMENELLRAKMTGKHTVSLGIQPLALSGPATQAGHLGRRAGLVDKDQAVALLSHDGLAGILPRGPGAGQFRPVLFACSERFF